MARLPATEKKPKGLPMLTPFVTALVVGNCMAGLCLVGSVALCGMGAGLDGGGAATNSFYRLARGAGRPFDIAELSKEEIQKFRAPD
jgi:hypothetical protein